MRYYRTMITGEKIAINSNGFNHTHLLGIDGLTRPDVYTVMGL